MPGHFVEPVDTAWMTAVDLKRFNTAIAVAIGFEVERCRMYRGWSRRHVSELLPSKLGERTVLAYEHGTRIMTMSRLAEVCMVLGVSVTDVWDRAMQAARLMLETTPLRVDLHKLLAACDPEWAPMLRWARNRLAEAPDGVVAVHPVSIRDLAATFGCDTADLTGWLTRFVPPPSISDYLQGYDDTADDTAADGEGSDDDSSDGDTGKDAGGVEHPVN